MAQNVGALEESSSDLHIEIIDDEKHKNFETVAVAELPDFEQSEVKRILRKIDLRLLPVLTALYLMSFLDRSNSQYLTTCSLQHKRAEMSVLSRKCQRRRSFQRSRPLLEAVQLMSDHLLLSLRPLRSPLQHRP